MIAPLPICPTRLVFWLILLDKRGSRRTSALLSPTDRTILAVYTTVTDEDLAGFLAAYDIGTPLSMKGIAEGVENSNFLLHVETGTYILTLVRKARGRGRPPLLHQSHGASGSTPGSIVRSRSRRERAPHSGGSPDARRPWSPSWKGSPCDGRRRRIARRPVRPWPICMGYGADFGMARPNALALDSWAPLFDRARSGAETVAQGLTAFIDSELLVSSGQLAARSTLRDHPCGSLPRQCPLPG